SLSVSFFFQAEDGIRDFHVTGVQTCALPISSRSASLSIIGARSSIAWLVLTLRFRAASLAPLVGLCKRLLPFQPAAHPIPERFHLFADPGLRVAEAGSIQRKFLGLDLDVMEHVLLA